MTETYASGVRGQRTPGGIILLVTSSLAALLVIAGVIYAMGTGGRHEAALAAAGCEPGLSPSGLPCTTAPMLTSRYNAIMTVASQELKAGEAAYTASEWDHLDAAEAALTAEVASEHAFDTSLAGVAFPPAVAPIARALIQADQARATLTAEQARSSSLPRMRSFNHRVQVASAAVQAEMESIRQTLDSPPPAN